MYHLYRRYDYGTYQSWVDFTNYPDFILVSEALYPPPFYLTAPGLGTSLCSWSIRHTRFTSVSGRVWRGGPQLTSPIPDGIVGWGKMVFYDGWKCERNPQFVYLL